MHRLKPDRQDVDENENTSPAFHWSISLSKPSPPSTNLNRCKLKRVKRLGKKKKTKKKSDCKSKLPERGSIPCDFPGMAGRSVRLKGGPRAGRRHRLKADKLENLSVVLSVQYVRFKSRYAGLLQGVGRSGRYFLAALFQTKGG